MPWGSRNLGGHSSPRGKESPRRWSSQQPAPPGTHNSKRPRDLNQASDHDLLYDRLAGQPSRRVLPDKRTLWTDVWTGWGLLPCLGRAACPQADRLAFECAPISPGVRETLERQTPSTPYACSPGRSWID